MKINVLLDEYEGAGIRALSTLLKINVTVTSAWSDYDASKLSTLLKINTLPCDDELLDESFDFQLYWRSTDGATAKMTGDDEIFQLYWRSTSPERTKYIRRAFNSFNSIEDQPISAFSAIAVAFFAFNSIEDQLVYITNALAPSMFELSTLLKINGRKGISVYSLRQCLSTLLKINWCSNNRWEHYMVSLSTLLKINFSADLPLLIA